MASPRLEPAAELAYSSTVDAGLEAAGAGAAEVDAAGDLDSDVGTMAAEDCAAS